MSGKQILAFGKLLVVLLLFSNTALSKTTMDISHFRDSKTVLLFNAEDSFHKNGLQPQVLSVRVIAEHHAKPVSFSYPLLPYDEGTGFVLGFVGGSEVFVQDANRCESVSRFLFPFHFFW